MSRAPLLAVLEGQMGSGWVALVVIAMVAMMGAMGWMMWSMMRARGHHGPAGGDDPAEILARRYARGDLTTEEYRERVDQLGRHAGGSSR